MKGIKSLFVASLLLLGAGVAMAQATYTDKDGAEYTFKKHMFLNLQGGAQYTLGEAKLKDQISPNVQLGLGYQFSPVFGVRLQANGWQSKGGWNGYSTSLSVKPITKDYKFNYVAPGLDFMFNLSNLFAGWNPNRVLNVVAFIGGGANIAWANDEVNAIASDIATQYGQVALSRYRLDYLWDGTKINPFGRGGIGLNFRLSSAVSLVVEGNANVLSDKYNSKKAGNADWYFNALAGLRVNLGKTNTKKEKEEPVYVAPEPVVEPTPEPAPVIEEKKVEPIRRDVFFVINSYKIRTTEEQKVKEIVDYLNANPEAKVTVTGYADAGTGNDRINDRLAKQRAESVVKTLVEKYNIPAARITSDSKGARVQPFAENDKNRVSICIAE